MAGQLRVQSACAFGERDEAHVAGCESDAGADSRDVVEVVPEPFELEEDRAGARDVRGRPQPENLLAGVCVGNGVGDRAGGARPRGVRDPFGEGVALGGAFEAAVLVEEPDVEMQDQVADDVEAKVAGLDHAGVDRAYRDLVGVVAAHRNGPGGEIEVVVDQWTRRLVTVEAHAVEVRGLTFVPVRSRGEIDDRRHASADYRDGFEVDRAVWRDERRAHDIACWQESPAKRARSRERSTILERYSLTRHLERVRARTRYRVAGQPPR